MGHGQSLNSDNGRGIFFSGPERIKKADLITVDRELFYKTQNLGAVTVLRTATLRPYMNNSD